MSNRLLITLSVFCAAYAQLADAQPIIQPIYGADLKAPHSAQIPGGGTVYGQPRITWDEVREYPIANYWKGEILNGIYAEGSGSAPLCRALGHKTAIQTEYDAPEEGVEMAGMDPAYNNDWKHWFLPSRNTLYKTQASSKITAIACGSSNVTTERDVTGLGPSKAMRADEVIHNLDGTTYYYHPRMDILGHTRVIDVPMEYTSNDHGVCKSFGHKQAVGIRVGRAKYWGLMDSVSLDGNGNPTLKDSSQTERKYVGVLCSDRDREEEWKAPTFEYYPKNPLASYQDMVPGADGTVLFVEPKLKVNGVDRNIVDYHDQADGACRALGFRFTTGKTTQKYHGYNDLALTSLTGGVGGILPWRKRDQAYAHDGYRAVLIWSSEPTTYLASISCANDSREGEPPSFASRMRALARGETPAPTQAAPTPDKQAPKTVKRKETVMDDACNGLLVPLQKEYEARQKLKRQTDLDFEKCIESEFAQDSAQVRQIEAVVAQLKQDETLRNIYLGLEKNPALKNVIAEWTQKEYLPLLKGFKSISLDPESIRIQSNRLAYKIGLVEPGFSYASESCAKKFPTLEDQTWERYRDTHLNQSCFITVEKEVPVIEPTEPSRSQAGAL